MPGNKQTGYECPRCKNNYSTAYSMYRHMRKVHNCDVNRCVTLYCPIENCNQSYDRYNALDSHLTHVHYADIRKETFNFSDLQDFETWLRDITSSSKTKYIKRSCNNSYRYYRCHRSGLPKTSTDKINSMKSSVKIGRHCPSRIIAKITDRSVQVEFVPTHIGHECEIAKIPLSQKKRQDIACRLAHSNNSVTSSVAANVTVSSEDQQPANQSINHNDHLPPPQTTPQTQTSNNNNNNNNNNQTGHQQQSATNASATSAQVTTSTLIQNDNSLVVTLAPMKSASTTAVPNQQQQQQPPLTNPIHHIVSHQMQQQQQQQQQQSVQQQLTNNPNMNLMIVTNPNRQELTSRFEQLMCSIRSDKHASIVKAQLEVCFALIRD